MQLNPEIGEETKAELLAEALHSRRSVKLKARGCSMLPAVWPGDLLTIEPAEPHAINTGDIVLVLRNNRFFVHRVVERREWDDCSLWITKGDAMPKNDPPATASHLLGKVVVVRRGTRTFDPSRRASAIVAWMLCHSSRIRSLALHIHAARLRAARAPAAQLDCSVSAAEEAPNALPGTGASHV
jgi:signal peptidase I